MARVEPQANQALGFFSFPNFNANSPKAPLPGLNGRISIRWMGTMTAPVTGDYALSVTSLGTGRLFLDDQLLIVNPPANNVTTTSARVRLVAGVAHTVRIEHRVDSPRQEGGRIGATLRFGWQPPAGTVPAMMRQAVDLARRSDVAVVVTRTYESEAFRYDRNNLARPNNQDQLVREVAAANPAHGRRRDDQGHGLSYTSFGYRNLRVAGGVHGQPVTVSLDVRNTGRRPR